ncbi:MAG: thiol-disulfide oxidoreductase DCC family protein [Hyphomicrobiaceae bacterium]
MTDEAGIVNVFYDGSCPLCTAEIGLYRRCVGAEDIAFVDVSVNGTGAIVPGLDKATAMKRFHVRDADGTLISGAEAFGHLWLSLPSWRWLGRIVLLPGILQASEVAYRAFLIVRPALQWIFRTTTSPQARL